MLPVHGGYKQLSNERTIPLFASIFTLTTSTLHSCCFPLFTLLFNVFLFYPALFRFNAARDKHSMENERVVCNNEGTMIRKKVHDDFEEKG